MEDNITSFRDLRVYQEIYELSLIIHEKVITKLPNIERTSLIDQMRRASKAVPRLIAEGYAKRHQKKGFQKYLDDANAESNEMIVCLCHCKDIYSKYFDVNYIKDLIDKYDKVSRSVYKLRKSWITFD